MARRRYDVFLSHRRDDKPFVEELASRLQDEAGLRPFLDKWHLVPGEPWQEALEVALDESATCAVCLGESGLGPWQNEELRSALDERIRDASLRVIPLLLPNADPENPRTLPRFLRRMTWVDFRRGIDREAFRRLVAGIRGELPGRDPDPPQSLIEQFASDNPEERIAAVKLLGAGGSPAAVGMLEGRWPLEPDPTVRYWLAAAMGAVGGDAARVALRRVRAVESNAFALYGIDEALEGAPENA